MITHRHHCYCLSVFRRHTGSSPLACREAPHLVTYLGRGYHTLVWTARVNRGQNAVSLRLLIFCPQLFRLHGSCFPGSVSPISSATAGMTVIGLVECTSRPFPHVRLELVCKHSLAANRLEYQEPLTGAWLRRRSSYLLVHVHLIHSLPVIPPSCPAPILVRGSNMPICRS